MNRAEMGTSERTAVLCILYDTEDSFNLVLKVFTSYLLEQNVSTGITFVLPIIMGFSSRKDFGVLYNMHV